MGSGMFQGALCSAAFAELTLSEGKNSPRHRKS